MHPVASMGKFAAGSQERKGVKYTGTWRIFPVVSTLRLFYSTTALNMP